MNQGIKILIAEDSPTQAAQLQHILEAHDYCVQVAENGQHALAMLREGEDAPSLVISDIVMPLMDGYTLCREIKQDERLKETPVMLLTSLSDPTDILRGLECGADNLLTKPYDERQLLSRVQYVLLNREVRRNGLMQMGMEIIFGGQRLIVTPERQQILDLLISSYETAVQKNLELQRVQEELKALSERLEEEVEERTSALTAEVSERKQVEAALREQQNFLRDVLDTAPNPIFVKNWKGRYTLVNKAMADFYRTTVENVVGKSGADFISKSEEAERFLRQDREVTETGQRQVILEETVTDQETGEVRWFHTIKTPLVSPDGQIRQILGVATDITERKKVEERLHESEERYRLLVDGVKDYAIFMLDTQGRIVSWNQGAERIKGYRAEEIIGEHFSRFYTAEDIEQGKPELEIKVAAEEGRYEEEGWRVRKDGTRFFANVLITALKDEAGALRGFSKVTRDITERKQAEAALRTSEEQLRQSQKLEAIGQLAGGIAHDFNNLLTVINGNSTLLLRGLSDERQSEMADEIKKAGTRAAQLTRQLLAFSRKQVLQPVVFNLNTVVPDIDKMLRRLIGADIDFLTALEPDLWQVKADPGQIEQVLMNLAINARDSMPKGGKLTVQTANVYLDESYTRSHTAVRPGPYVMLAVSDTGHGMDAEIQRKIFEPFFTTKEKGKGTGLGLSTVYGIVKQSGGNIWVYSEVGRGTTFKIYLPCVAEDPELRTQAAPQAATPQGFETILLAEDEETVRKLARNILELNGYRVLAAVNCQEALSLCEHHEGPIHLLLTDVVMPQMSGRELAERSTALRPAMKVLYMSGYTDDSIVHHGVLDADVAFLEKPFTPDAMARKVREVLDDVQDAGRGPEAHAEQDRVRV